VTPRETVVALRLWFWAAVIRPLKRTLPLETLVRLVHCRPSGHDRSKRFEVRLARYLSRTGRFPSRPPANCLERSLGVYRMLCRANALPELVIGVRHAAGRGVEGHVWVMVDGFPFAEPSADLASFTPIVRFDAKAQRHSSAGAPPLLAAAFARLQRTKGIVLR
jgi:hypothetical protein